MSEWTLIGAGNSISELDDEGEGWALGTTVAVNRAYFRFPWVDAWSISEHPDRMFGWKKGPDLEKRRHQWVVSAREHLAANQSTIWAPQAKGVTKICDYFEGITEIERYLIFETSREVGGQGRLIFLPPWGKTRVQWRTKTVMMTLLRMIHKGAESIRVVGVDLCGAGGYGHADQNAPAWEARWKEERELLEAAIEECAQHGVEIDWRRAEVVA